MLKLLVAVFGAIGLTFSADPFLNKQDALGYIVVEKKGRTVKYIVVRTSEGSIKLIETSVNPSDVLKKELNLGGKVR